MAFNCGIIARDSRKRDLAAPRARVNSSASRNEKPTENRCSDLLNDNAVIFGVAIIPVLNVPALSTNAYIWIPVVVVASLILAAPVAWLIAPRLQARYDRWHTK